MITVELIERENPEEGHLSGDYVVLKNFSKDVHPTRRKTDTEI